MKLSLSSVPPERKVPDRGFGVSKEKFWFKCSPGRVYGIQEVSCALTLTEADPSLLFADHWGSPDCFQRTH